MLRRLYNACLIRPSDLTPSQEDLEVIGTFNPGAIATKDGVMLLVRVAEQPKEKRPGYTGLPRWDANSGTVLVDWTRNDEIATVDVRVVRTRKSDVVRLTFISHLRALHSHDGRQIDFMDRSRFTPEGEDEEFGVEDPRITKIGDTFYFTYVAVSRHGAATALAATKDFKTFQRSGIIFPPENKDVVLFSEKIGGQYCALHRPNPAQHFCKPEMWFATSPDLVHWGGHVPFLCGSEQWDIGRIGAGAPPFRTREGWLEIYHGNSRRAEEQGIGSYSGAAVLLDLDNPRRVLKRSGAIFVPEMDFEREGFVPNVVFATGAVEHGEKLLVYYGAADTSTGVVEFSLNELLSTLKEV